MNKALVGCIMFVALLANVTAVHATVTTQVRGLDKGVWRPMRSRTVNRPIKGVLADSVPRASISCGATQVITIVNDAAVPVLLLMQLERALQDQSVQLRDAWGTPCVIFDNGGWPVMLETTAPPECGSLYRPGCHVVGSTVGYVEADYHLSLTASHEVMEMLADPLGTGTEICDPVENLSYGYQLDGLTVSDFTLPSNFDPRGTVPFDKMGYLAARRLLLL